MLVKNLMQNQLFWILVQIFLFFFWNFLSPGGQVQKHRFRDFLNWWWVVVAGDETLWDLSKHFLNTTTHHQTPTSHHEPLGSFLEGP